MWRQPSNLIKNSLSVWNNICETGEEEMIFKQQFTLNFNF